MLVTLTQKDLQGLRWPVLGVGDTKRCPRSACAIVASDQISTCSHYAC